MGKVNYSISCLIVLCLGISLNYYFSDKKFSDNNNKRRFNVVELIQHFGYPVETHEVISDGYILTLHRIPHGRNSAKNETDRIPVLFVHGILNSAAEYVNLGPEKALSLQLAEKNYDIWLANVRGTTWSRKHTKLDPDKDKEQFWDFNFHQIGSRDLPTYIDYILDRTNQTKLHYVGYSQGTFLLFLMGSEKPEYMEKLRLVTAMAPSAFFDNLKSPFFRFLKSYPFLVDIFFKLFNIHEFLPADGYYSKFLKIICDENSFFVSLCIHNIFILHGYNYEQLNMSMLRQIYSNLPAGSSANQILHLIQILKSGRFAQFDLGPEQNLIKYGQIEPPAYNISKTTKPIALYYGPNDWLCQLKDIKRIARYLPNIVKIYRVPDENFNHQDFLHAIDADKLVYHSIIEEIEKF